MVKTSCNTLGGPYGMSWESPIPRRYGHYCVMNRDIVFVYDIPSDAVVLDLNVNKIRCLPELPPTLKELYISRNELVLLPELPEGLEVLACVGNNLKSLPKLPSTLRYLRADLNPLVSIPELPDSLEVFQVDFERFPAELQVYWKMRYTLPSQIKKEDWQSR